MREDPAPDDERIQTLAHGVNDKDAPIAPATAVTEFPIGGSMMTQEIVVSTVRTIYIFGLRRQKLEDCSLLPGQRLPV